MYVCMYVYVCVCIYVCWPCYLSNRARLHSTWSCANVALTFTLPYWSSYQTNTEVCIIRLNEAMYNRLKTPYTSAAGPAPLLGYNTESPLGSSWNVSGAENCPAILHSMFLEQLQSAIPTIEIKTCRDNTLEFVKLAKNLLHSQKTFMQTKIPNWPHFQFAISQFCLVESWEWGYECYTRMLIQTCGDLAERANSV